MTVLEFRDSFRVYLRGSGSYYDRLREYYADVVTDADPHTADLTFEIGEISTDPELILGDPVRYYGREGDRFVRQDKAKVVTIDRDWNHIQATDALPRSLVFKLLEFRPRLSRSREDEAMIHASAVYTNGTTLVFPAWRHTGKTNTLLTILREHGGEYLSDDRLWIDADGIAYGFPVPVNLLPYNQFSSLTQKNRSRLHRVRHRLGDWLIGVTHSRTTFPARALYFFSEFYLTPSPQKARIEDIVPGVQPSESASIDALVYLQTVDDAGSVEMTEIDADQATRRLAAINEREWNDYLRSLYSPRDALFPNEDSMADLRELERNERAVFDAVNRDHPTYQLTLPREENWDKRDLSEEVLRALDSLF